MHFVYAVVTFWYLVIMVLHGDLQVLGLHGNASRSLLSAVIMFAGPFAKPLIEAVLVPCASSDKLGNRFSTYK